MTPRLISLAIAASTLACAPVADTLETAPSSANAASVECEVGIYRANADRFVALTRSGKGFRYTFNNGIVGTIGAPDANVSCGPDSVRVKGDGAWARMPIVQTDTRFNAAGVQLAGRLMEPVGADEATPLIVYAHGSEDTAWIERARDPYQMVGRGISVFVYDKRGTGQSEGQYSQNFPQLADDMVAATKEARRLAEGRFGRVGLVGLSQGGWIAPLASERADADFIGIGYGLVADIREEDADQVQRELRDAGYDDSVLSIGRQITDVTARIASSDYTDGLDELTELQELYSNEPWFSVIRGGFSGVLINLPADELRQNGVPQFNSLNIDWTLDPMSVMRETDVPQLWVLAGEDREAPIELTSKRLSTLKGEGKDITIYTFPDTDHGMWEFFQQQDGTRELTRVTPGFYDLMADWAKGEVTDGYGAGSLMRD